MPILHHNYLYSNACSFALMYFLSGAPLSLQENIKRDSFTTKKMIQEIWKCKITLTQLTDCFTYFRKNIIPSLSAGLNHLVPSFFFFFLHPHTEGTAVAIIFHCSVGAIRTLIHTYIDIYICCEAQTHNLYIM